MFWLFLGRELRIDSVSKKSPSKQGEIWSLPVGFSDVFKSHVDRFYSKNVAQTSRLFDGGYSERWIFLKSMV